MVSPLDVRYFTPRLTGFFAGAVSVRVVIRAAGGFGVDRFAGGRRLVVSAFVPVPS